MSDVMRDEFEAWVQRRAARSPAGYHPRLIKRCELDPDRYATSWVDSAFEGWQGFQECLVIDLHDRNASIRPLEVGRAVNAEFERCKSIIELAGLKVKK